MQAEIIDCDDLRHKVIAYCYLHMGFHKVDIQRLEDSMLEDHPNYKHRYGQHKPKIVIRGIHNKRPNIKVRNVVACGCSGDHRSNNEFCEYAIWKGYMKIKQDCDDEYHRTNFLRMNTSRKKAHYEDGIMGPERVLKELNFMRTVSKDKNKYHHQNMGIHEIGNGLEFWNRKLNLRPGVKITSDMARKTFCTLGEKFFKFDRNLLKNTSHHQTDENFEIYVCDDYEDLEEESHITVTMQKWAQKKYIPPVHVTPTVMLAELNEKIQCVSELTTTLSAMIKLQSTILINSQWVKKKIHTYLYVN